MYGPNWLVKPVSNPVYWRTKEYMQFDEVHTPDTLVCNLMRSTESDLLHCLLSCPALYHSRFSTCTSQVYLPVAPMGHHWSFYFNDTVAQGGAPIRVDVREIGVFGLFQLVADDQSNATLGSKKMPRPVKTWADWRP